MNKENMKGNVLVFVLIVLTLVLILGTGIIAKSLVSQQHSLKQVSDQQAYYIAKSVLDGMKEHFTNPSTANSAVALLPTGNTAVTSTVEIGDKQGRKWNCKVIIENNKIEENELEADQVRITVTATENDKAVSSKETISMVLKQKQETDVGEGIAAPQIEIKGNSGTIFKHDLIYAEKRIEISGNSGISTQQLQNLVAGEEIQIKANSSSVFTKKLYCGIQNNEIPAKRIEIKGNSGIITIEEGIFYKDSPQIDIEEDVKDTILQKGIGASIPKITVPVFKEDDPEDWGDIDQIGEVIIEKDIKVKKIKIESHSNRIKIKGNIEAEEIEISSNSGSIEIDGNITASKEIKINDNSGQLNIKGNIVAGEGIEIQRNSSTILGSKEIGSSNSGDGSASFEFIKYE